ncbi:hypothetical protein [Rhizobium sp. IBUN]|uniref:hypothetical protein n=1 Tax=Rhizobium sp. IBUN TaxID=1042326 RepID=UPI0012EC148E|nr:hypothetical protein [Rhizobium sp. IBUN]
MRRLHVVRSGECGKSMLNAIRTVRTDAWNSTAARNGAGDDLRSPYGHTWQLL